MDNCKVFFTKFDEVLELMVDGKLRVDIDDTLLEKLLGVFREQNYQAFFKTKCCDSTQFDKTAYLKVFLDKTTVCSFLEKALCSHQSSGFKLNVSVETFALFLLGVFVEQETIFLSEEIQRLLLFLDTFLAGNISSLPPSTLVAVLSCVTSIAHHDAGISWLVEKGILNSTYSLFSGSTYYVQEGAVNFFTTVFVAWSTSLFFHARTTTNGICQIISSFIERFIMNLQPNHGSEKKHIVSECCIRVLRLSMEKSHPLHSFLYEHFQLSSKVLNILKGVLAETEPQESIIQLLVESLTCSNAYSSSIVTEVLQVFLQHKLIASVIFLMSSLFPRQYSTGKLVSKDQLAYVVWPIVTLSGIFVDFGPPEKEFVKILTLQMTEKSRCFKLVQMSLIALSKLTHLLNTETLSLIINAYIEVLHHAIGKQAQSTMQQNISGNKKIQVSILQFFSAVMEEPVCQKLTSSIVLHLVDSLISAVENPSCDNNRTTQALKLISKAQGSNVFGDFPKDLKKRLAEMVQKKLHDAHWPVVDTSLELVAQIVKGCRDDELWKEWICSVGIYTAVSDVAANSEAEGYVRAMALHVLVLLFLCPFMWGQLKSQQGANEDTIVSVLYRLSNDPDVFVQRESVCSLFKWIQASHVKMPSNNSTTVFKILTNAVKCSLDCDTKLIALRAWQWVAEKELSCFSSPTQKNKVKETLMFLCDVGYGTSLLSALSDYDITVQHEAAQALLSFRQTLLDLGLDETSVILNNISVTSSPAIDSSESIGANACNSSSFELENDEFHVNSRSQEEINAAINDVLNLDTHGQIHKLLRSAQGNVTIQECSSLFNNPFSSPPFGNMCSCSLDTFWKNLWSKELESVLNVSSRSTDIYVDNPVALLDDIIAAKTDISCGEYQEADCY